MALMVLLLQVEVFGAGAAAAGGSQFPKAVGKEGEGTQTVLGSLVANTIRIMAPAEGVVAEVHAREGDEVKAGDLLVRMDDRRAQAALQVAEVEVKSAASELRRLETMREAKTVAEAEFERAQAVLAVAQAKLVLMRQDLADTRIVAPVSGNLAACDARPGEVVGRGALLGRLVTAEALKVWCRIPESLVARVRKGQKAVVKVAAYPEEVFEGEICFIAPEVDIETATIVVKVQLFKVDRRLLPGMTARVTVEMGR